MDGDVIQSAEQLTKQVSICRCRRNLSRKAGHRDRAVVHWHTRRLYKSCITRPQSQGMFNDPSRVPEIVGRRLSHARSTAPLLFESNDRERRRLEIRSGRDAWVLCRGEQRPACIIISPSLRSGKVADNGVLAATAIRVIRAKAHRAGAVEFIIEQRGIPFLPATSTCCRSSASDRDVSAVSCKCHP